VDRAEALSELDRVALLLSATADAIEVEDPAYAIAVEPMRKSATYLREAIENLRALWEES
jgi:hypothetical protein